MLHQSNNKKNQPSSPAIAFLLALLVLTLPNIGFAESANAAKTKDQEQETKDSEQDADSHCRLNEEKQDWVDGIRLSTYRRLCGTVRWVDGLFGDEHEFNEESFRGKVSFGYKHDEVEGFDPRLRVRIRAKLPNASNRFNAFIGRVDEESYISDTENIKNNINVVGLRSNDEENAEWLFGLGYRNPNSKNNGFDYSIGGKLSGGIKPYAKIKHYHLFKQNESTFWKTRQTIFWRKKDGYGVSSNLDYTKLLTDRDILEWDTSIKYTENAKQWEWITSTTWHHSFTDRKGISSRAYIRGEEENPVSIPEYGITFTYVKPFLKPWLSLETGIDFRWEKFNETDRYENSIRYGIQLNMLLGDYYGLNKHKRNR